MNRICLILIAIFTCGWMYASDLGSSFKNDHLKATTYKDRPICCSTWFREADGIWESESKDSGKALVFPQQVKISCHNYGNNNRKCVEIIVTLAATKTMVILQEIDTEEYDIDRWDEHGLIASYGGDDSSKCQRHVLTMDFESGAVSVSDIPTHKKGCEAFIDTDSYRLVRGNYYVDTSPNNDMDKPMPLTK
jgi:hypothetical protein